MTRSITFCLAFDRSPLTKAWAGGATVVATAMIQRIVILVMVVVERGVAVVCGLNCDDDDVYDVCVYHLTHKNGGSK